MHNLNRSCGNMYNNNVVGNLCLCFGITMNFQCVHYITFTPKDDDYFSTVSHYYFHHNTSIPNIQIHFTC